LGWIVVTVAVPRFDGLTLVNRGAGGSPNLVAKGDRHGPIRGRRHAAHALGV